MVSGIQTSGEFPALDAVPDTLAMISGALVGKVTRLAIWSNHSDTQFPHAWHV
jgi:hypothetical protein